MNNKLYKGIFWIVDIEELANNESYIFKIECQRDGSIYNYDPELTAKKGNNYNHEKTWNKLSRILTSGHPYNYYPRGRVEIASGKAKIFLNPAINNEMVIEYLIRQYNLKAGINIDKITIINDNSQHYQYLIDTD